jgi:hypothetical protein
MPKLEITWTMTTTSAYRAAPARRKRGDRGSATDASHRDILEHMVDSVLVVSSAPDLVDHGVRLTPAIFEWLAALVVTRPAENYAGLVIDLRSVDLAEIPDYFARVASLRRTALDWVRGAARGHAKPDAARPVVMVLPVGGREAMTRWLDLHGGPALWFSLGIDVLEAGRLGTNDDGIAPRRRPSDGEAIVKVAAEAIKRLRVHPLVAMGERARSLFRTPHGDRAILSPLYTHYDDRGFPACPDGSDARPAAPCELGIICPGTYQLEGSLSVPLPSEVRRSVLHHVLARITPRSRRGYTALQGRGWWLNDMTAEGIEEPVDLVLIHTRLRPQVAKRVAAYLRWAWLQDEVFVTFDGRALPMEPGAAAPLAPRRRRPREPVRARPWPRERRPRATP